MFHSIDFYEPEHFKSDGVALEIGEISIETGLNVKDNQCLRSVRKKFYSAGDVITMNSGIYRLLLIRYSNNITTESGFVEYLSNYESVTDTSVTYTLTDDGYYRYLIRTNPIIGTHVMEQEDIIAVSALVDDIIPYDPIRNTYRNWYLVPSKRPVFSTPAVKKHVVEIPGGDGSIDMTEALAGRPTYSNRTGSFEFYVLNDYSEYGPKVYDWVSIHEDLMAFLHGQRRYAVLEDDPGYFYDGRFTVDDWSSESDYARVTIGYDVAPFKYKVDPTDITLEQGTIGTESGGNAEGDNAARSVGDPILFHKGDRIRMESSGLYGNVHHLTQVMYYPGSTIASYRSGGYVAHTYNEGGNEYVFTKDGYYRFVFEKYNYTDISDSDLNEIKNQIRLYERGLL